MAFTPEEWFQNIPKFTRYWMIGMLGTLFLAAMGIIPLGSLLFIWDEVKQFQVCAGWLPTFACSHMPSCGSFGG